jgi:putative SOS response-associated peptidase YedK
VCDVTGRARARGRLHNRMPVILRQPEDEALWLADRELSSKCAQPRTTARRSCLAV